MPHRLSHFGAMLPLAAILWIPTASAADELYCSVFGGSLSGDLNENLKVDTDCLISYSTVNGNVEFVGPYHLTITDSLVNGNIDCNRFGTLEIIDSTVNGNTEECQGGWNPAKRRRFHAWMDGYQEVPAVSTVGEGQFLAEVERDDGVLRYALRYRDLEGGDVLSARIHFGRRGTNGDVIAFLCSNTPPPTGVNAPACPAEGETWEGVLDRFDVIGPDAQGIDAGEAAEALEALRAGAGYVNVYTESFPEGEIRGQIEDGRGKKKKQGGRN